jgi:bacillithiol biosynthesis deacetylase BshB1
MKLDILAIGVHPDDVELCCSGTLLKHIDAGAKIGILDLTRGELGTRGNAEIRISEANEAARRMGVLVRENVGLADGFFQYSEQAIITIIPFIRKYQPRIVLCNAIDDRHPDHGRSSKLVSDACFYSGLLKIETTTASGVNQERWRPEAVYHYIQDRLMTPDLVVDITPFFKRKMNAIKAFSSQFYDPNSIEPSSPISGEDFLEYITASNRIMGRYIGVIYAEGFMAERPIGVRSLFDLD